jgi:hypothetical protein
LKANDVAARLCTSCRSGIDGLMPEFCLFKIEDVFRRVGVAVVV